jgi:carbohydrate-selective porin OprB
MARAYFQSSSNMAITKPWGWPSILVYCGTRLGITIRPIWNYRPTGILRCRTGRYDVKRHMAARSYGHVAVWLAHVAASALAQGWRLSGAASGMVSAVGAVEFAESLARNPPLGTTV